jgi:predicted acyl esterase
VVAVLAVVAVLGDAVGTGIAPASGLAPAPFEGHGSVQEAYVEGATPGTHLDVVNASGVVVGAGVVDRLGSLIVRNLAPGGGYRFDTTSSSSDRASAPFSVLSTHSTPPESFYAGQHMHLGLNYVRMRDGVTLAATVRLPPGKTLAEGPFPTVIEYSGYATAAPHSLIDALEGKTSSKDPLLPDTATIVGSVITPLLGFATVSVQMRGTGCSGGAFDLFGLPSDYDGYDVVQTVGAQPWVAHHKVGLVGISYSGLSQFSVAGTDPPDLAAIAPLSATDDLFSTGYPGGIYNNGFANSWLQQRIVDAQAAPQGGQRWAAAEIAAGDGACLANQRLHPEAQALVSLVSPDLARVPALFDRRSPAAWATHVTVPVFLVGALEDEQTGPQWPVLIDALDKDPHVYATMLNGTHIDSLGPDTLSRWLEFLDIYVAERVPTQVPILSVLAPLVYAEATGGAPTLAPPALRFTTAPSVRAARTAFASEDPRVRVLFDNGGGSLGAGALQPTYEAGFTSWPPQGAVTRYYFGTHGTLGTHPGPSAATSFRPDPSARPATDLPTGNAWAAQPPYIWTTVPTEAAVAFETSPFASATTVVGPVSLDLWLKSTAEVSDLQATVSEVRPGETGEEYITSGFLRSANRTLSSLSTTLMPVPTYLASDRRPLRPGRFTEVRIPIDPIAHTFRADTRLRVVISAPGGDRPAWAFDSPTTHGTATDTLALGGVEASSLAVNLVTGVAPAAALPACGALRGEPCRTYVPAANQQ